MRISDWSSDVCSSDLEAEGEHIVVTAGSLSGADNLTTETTLLPFLYKGELTATATQLIVDVSRKDVDELGLNRSEASAFNAVIDAAAADELVEGVFLQHRGDHFGEEIGRASCRERVGQYVSIPGVRLS